MNTDAFLAAALRNPVNKTIAAELFRLALPDAWLVSGCLVQTVWNVLTARAVDHGIADYDIFYFDPDTSWAAEDAVIRRLQNSFAALGVTIEARNQARVHLWYAEKHGLPYPPVTCATEGIDRFLTKNTQVELRRAREGHDVYAPNGFYDIARPDRAAQSGAEFLGGELRGEGRALEEAVAGTHGAGGASLRGAWAKRKRSTNSIANDCFASLGNDERAFAHPTVPTAPRRK